MNVICRLLKLANKIDKTNIKLSDKLEKISSNYIDTFTSQQNIEKGYKNFGGSDLGDSSLGGYHTQLELENNNFDEKDINDAMSLIHELSSPLPEFNIWKSNHSNLQGNLEMIYSILQILHPFYLAGVNSPSKLQSILGMSGPIDLQFATQSPSAAHSSWGITPQEIMQHEQAHARGTQSSPQEYMQHAVPGADFMETGGVGGNINPVAGYYQQLMQQFMQGQGPQEYGPNLDIWRRIVKERAPQI